MSTTEIRANIIKELNQTEDIGLLEEVHHLIDNYKKKIIGYHSDGTPVGVEEFRREAEESIKRIESGEFVTVEELRAKIKA